MSNSSPWRLTIEFVIFLACWLTLSLPLAGQEITSTTDMERQIFEWTNQERAKVNAPPLNWDNHLVIAARLHSDEMAKQKELSHQLKGEPVFTERLSEQGARFSAAAENIGFGDDAETLQSGWMHSPLHRANLLNPVYTEMGVGIVRSGNRLWATEDFTTAIQRLSSEDFEQAVEHQIAARRKSRGLAAMTATGSSQLRRIACSGDSSGGAALAAVPRRNMQAYSFNFTAPRADQLPTSLVNRLLEMPGGGYSIGACMSQSGNNGMTTYRVLLVLYR
ncbi:MAG TPA: CAP domain-containing protein [Terriglobales bacterium]|nr:CAP domain-containing protein [Terriglobales bacterium]